MIVANIQPGSAFVKPRPRQRIEADLHQRQQLPQRLAEFRRQHPAVALRMHDVTSERCLELIGRGDVDFGISAHPGPEMDSLSSVRQQMTPLLSKTQVRDTGMEVANFGSAAGLVAAGFGITLVPEHVIQLCLRPG